MSALKLLIVDDERLIRQGIRLMLEGSGLSFNEIIEADGGRSAVRLARQHSPEIILMDIKMPGLDGLSAAREICGFNSVCKIIFLTAYDNFEYAREAIRCRASDFLVKPVSREELIKTIQSCTDEISRYIGNRRKEARNKRALLYSVEESLVSELSSGTGMSPQKLWSRLRAISPPGGPWFDSNRLPNVCIVFKPEGDLSAGVLGQARNVRIKDALLPFILARTNDHIICLSWVPESGGEARNISCDVALALADRLSRTGGAGIRTGIGRVCSELKALRQSYAEACRALDNGTAGANICHIDSIDEDRIFSRPYKVVQQVIRYLESNYSKKISLEDAARQVYLNPVYLSSIIKQETGHTFSDYLTLIRVEQAKKMLASKIPVKEVARGVGYRDSNYFCRVFKKVTGVTATDFRKN